MHAVLSRMTSPEALICGALSLLQSDATIANDGFVIFALQNSNIALDQVRKVAKIVDSVAICPAPDFEQNARAAHAELVKVRLSLDSALDALRQCERRDEYVCVLYSMELLALAHNEILHMFGVVQRILSDLHTYPEAADVIEQVQARAKQTPRAATSDTNPTQKFATHACNRAATLHAMAEAAGALLASQDFSASHPQAWHAGEVLAEMAAIAQQLTNDSADAQYADTRGAA